MPNNNGEERIVIDVDEVVTVFLGKDQVVVPEFASHPGVHWISAETGNDVTEVVGKIPPKTRAFLLTNDIPHPIYHRLTNEARSHRLPYLHRKNVRALRAALYDFFPKKPKLGDGVPGDRGKIQRFLDANPPDLKAGTAEEARRLLPIARENGVTTTHASLAMAIAKRKRKGGRTDLPKSIRSAKDNALDTLDEVISRLQDSIAGLQLMRDWVTTTTDENVNLKISVESIRKMLGPGASV